MMNNKQFAIHTFCLLLFIAGCVVFWYVNVDENENEDENQNVCQVTENKNNYITSEGKGKDTSHNTSMKADCAVVDSGRISPFYSKSSVEKSKRKIDSLKSRDVDDGVFAENNSEESTTSIDEEVGFNHIGEKPNLLKDNAIYVIIHGTQKLNDGGQVKLRLLDDVVVDGVNIPKNTVVYAKVSMVEERVCMQTEFITYKSHDYPFDGNVYDIDGKEGVVLSDKKMSLQSGYKLTIRRK
ncbi:MAG: conjugative transposon protein TraM [Paludibacteraceae bacterium]|nr:conjugative transposon protein TraM [Paludibacteraceae bacterium]